MSPMIFEKAFSMVQNVKIQENRIMNNFDILVVDIAKSNWNWKNGEPDKNNSEYYSRQYKTFSRIKNDAEFLALDNKDFLINLNKILLDL
jgi:hypothetical protein